MKLAAISSSGARKSLSLRRKSTSDFQCPVRRLCNVHPAKILEGTLGCRCCASGCTAPSGNALGSLLAVGFYAEHWTIPFEKYGVRTTLRWQDVVFLVVIWPILLALFLRASLRGDAVGPAETMEVEVRWIYSVVDSFGSASHGLSVPDFNLSGNPTRSCEQKPSIEQLL